MDLTNPIRSVLPGARGEVLAVLARAGIDLSGRRIAELTNGRVSQKGTNLVLRSLVESGLVTVEDHPPAKLYSLNRVHLAAPSLEVLADLHGQLLKALRARLVAWEKPADAAWLFGSAARSDGTTRSDLDLIVVRPDEVADDDPVWTEQTERLATDASAWTGNSCEVIEYDTRSFAALMAGKSRLARAVRTDGIPLTDSSSARF